MTRGEYTPGIQVAGDPGGECQQGMPSESCSKEVQVEKNRIWILFFDPSGRLARWVGETWGVPEILGSHSPIPLHPPHSRNGSTPSAFNG